jgi:hypothetical protein
MKSENNLAGIYDPRGRAIPGDELLYNTLIANLVDIKASRTLESWSVQQLRDAGMPHIYKQGGSSHIMAGIQQRLKAHINKRLAWCNEAVDAQIEYFAMQALQGSITWPPTANDGSAISPAMPHWNATMTFTVPMGLPSAQNQAATTLTGYDPGSGAATGGGAVWSDFTNADPILDLETINEYMAKTFGVGMRGGTIYLSTVDLRNMSRCSNVLDWFVGTNKEQTGARAFVDQGDLINTLKTNMGWTIKTYDAQWTHRANDPMKSPTVQRVDFLTQGKILILPPGGAVGGMMTAPIESEPGGAWVYGKMGWSHQDDTAPPWDITLGVNAVAFPRFSHYDWFVLDTLN